MADIVDRAQEIEQMHLQQAISMLNNTSSNRPTATHCHDCKDPIPEARRHAMPGVQKCVDCAD